MNTKYKLYAGDNCPYETLPARSEILWSSDDGRSWRSQWSNGRMVDGSHLRSEVSGDGDKVVIRVPCEPVELELFDIVVSAIGRVSFVAPSRVDDKSDFAGRYISKSGTSDGFDLIVFVDGEPRIGSISHGKIETIKRLDDVFAFTAKLFNGKYEEAYDIAVNGKHTVIYEGETITVQLGDSTAEVFGDGKFLIRGNTGDIKDVEKAFELMDSNQKDFDIRAFDVLELDGRYAIVSQSPDDDDELVVTYFKSIKEYSAPDGWDQLEDVLRDDEVKSVMRPDHSRNAFAWLHGLPRNRTDEIGKLKTVRSQLSVKFGEYRVEKLNKNSIKVGCQTITREQLEELKKALEEGGSK